MIERLDKYTILVDGHRVTATADQEQRIRNMNPEQRERFIKVMGLNRADAIDQLANEWQNGAWADCPWVPDVVEQRLVSSNYFLTWLRNKAALTRGKEVN